MSPRERTGRPALPPAGTRLSVWAFAMFLFALFRVSQRCVLIYVRACSFAVVMSRCWHAYFLFILPSMRVYLSMFVSTLLSPCISYHSFIYGFILLPFFLPFYCFVSFFVCEMDKYSRSSICTSYTLIY